MCDMSAMFRWPSSCSSAEPPGSAEERLVHTVVIATILRSTRALPNGALDPRHQDYLTLATFLSEMMDDLAADRSADDTDPAQ